MPDQAAILAAVQSLDATLRTAVAEQQATKTELVEMREQLASYLPKDVARAKMRAVFLTIGLVFMLGVGSFVIVLRFKSESDQRAREQQATLVAGCERANDQRDTLREIINDAVAPSPAPAGLSPELQELYRQSQERVTALRAKLLALPGVQPVDCKAAFTPAKAAR